MELTDIDTAIYYFDHFIWFTLCAEALAQCILLHNVYFCDPVSSLFFQQPVDM